ncbi:MAG: ABC transporter ATP-binding protein [Halobacteriaceae archaeon]
MTDAARDRSTQAIRVEGLTKRYGNTTAIENLDLWIPTGSVYGFLGPNGAGKTTTMRILTTLTRPTEGQAHVAGHSVSNRDAVIPHIGFLPEDEPDVLFLDEPTSGLDPRAARTVRDTIDSLAEDESTTVFLSTHILPVVDELADSVGVLSNGRLVTEGPPAELKRRAAAGETTEERTLEDVFLEVTGDYEEGAEAQ